MGKRKEGQTSSRRKSNPELTNWIPDVVAPLWLFISLWTANTASKCHLKLLILSASKNITYSAVLFKNLIIFFSLAQSLLVGAFTCFVKNDTAGEISCLALLDTNRALYTNVTSSSALPFCSAGLDESTLNRLVSC